MEGIWQNLNVALHSPDVSSITRVDACI